ncbi:MAG: exocyst complex component exo84 [Thelocarpon superellum]|nr:MAG: exocyst complex component exo84 [Thelocarpon superellum]
MDDKDKDRKEKKGVFSLRKKRNNAPAARRAQISSPLPTPDPTAKAAASSAAGKSAAASQQLRPPQTGGKTADFVKRRYSTRPGAFPQGFRPDAPPIPSMPGLPGHVATGSGSGSMSMPGPGDERPGSSGRGRPSMERVAVTVDINDLKDPNLRPDQYVASILAAASEDEIRDYQRNLLKARTRTSTDLQHNVYQNRTKFIEISREAERLKGEMRMLRTLMSDLKANTSALNQASSHGNGTGTADTATPSYDAMTATARKQANRSSVANLEAMWNTQLQTLWKNVEGSQRFLPAVPGRHIIKDSPQWVELNAATWKSRRAIHMFLLNDHLLVASRKKRRVDPAASLAQGVDAAQQPVQSKLVAERCWPLQDIQMLDLSSSLGLVGGAEGGRERANVVNAINIRVGQESFTYRNDRPDSKEKGTLLLMFRKAVEELRKASRSQGDGAKDALNYLASPDPGAPPTPDLSNPRAGALTKQQADLTIDVDGKQHTLRWLENQVDELDMAIALQRFDEAVAGIERLRKLAKGLRSNAIAQHYIQVQAGERADTMADLVTRRLVDTHSFLHATQQNIGWLVRLNYEDRARESYLEARGAVIVKRTRQCIFEGDLQQYIFQISFVYFTIIRNTITIYQACFPALMMSACVKWAKEQVDAFNQILGRQLSSFDHGSDVWQECIETAQQHAVMLTEVGLDFKHLVGGAADGDPAAEPFRAV